MPVRVDLTEDAAEDLAEYAKSGNVALFLSKLVRLEEVGKQAGLPLGGGLAGWRKIVVGDRNWRIIFSVNADATVATVWVIGDRDDSACYDKATQRVAASGKDHPVAASLAAVMLKLMQARRKQGRSNRS